MSTRKQAPRRFWFFSHTLPSLAIGAVFVPTLGCGEPASGSPWDDAEFVAQADDVRQHYAVIVERSYADSLAAAQAMKVAIDAFVAAPSPDNLAAARTAWLVARDIYGQTEAYRFYGGPIDVEPDGPEGQINAWPLDEVYIDYVDGQPDAGIVAAVDLYPTIDRDLLIDLNEAGGETNVSTGWHAIEFLLWGQDLNADGPGERPHTDYIPGDDGPQRFAERRATYLQVATDLLVDDLASLVAAWAPGSMYYQAFTTADPQASVRDMLFGLGSLAGAELAGERMTVAFDTRDQEDEHSCFSDNTHRDLWANAVGLENVYLGRFGGTAGPGLSALVARQDPELDQRLRTELQAAISAMEAIPVPFDQAIQGPDDSPGREAIADAIAALERLTASLVEAATALEISLNLEA